MKLQQQKNGQYTITLPLDLIKAYDWNKGDNIEFKVLDRQSIKIYKK